MEVTQQWFVDSDVAIGRCPGPEKPILPEDVVCPKMVWHGKPIERPTMRRHECEQRIWSKNPTCEGCGELGFDCTCDWEEIEVTLEEIALTEWLMFRYTLH